MSEATETRLVGEFDAVVWAREFVRVAQEKPEIASDEGTMIGWFANAIMAGYDRGRGEHPDDSGLGDARGKSALAGGVTWADVDRLRAAAEQVISGYSPNMWAGPLADRIEALLPPREQETGRGANQ